MLLIEYVFLNWKESSGLRLFSDGKVEVVKAGSSRIFSSEEDITTIVGVYSMMPERAQTLAERLDAAGFFRFRADYFPSFMLMADFYERIKLNKDGRAKTVCCHGRRPGNAVYNDVVEELRNYLAIFNGLNENTSYQ